MTRALQKADVLAAASAVIEHDWRQLATLEHGAMPAGANVGGCYVLQIRHGRPTDYLRLSVDPRGRARVSGELDPTGDNSKVLASFIRLADHELAKFGGSMLPTVRRLDTGRTINRIELKTLPEHFG